MDAGWDALKARVAGATAGSQIGVQSTYVDAAGNRVAIMRDGSTQILGQNDAGMSQQTISVTGPDGRPAQYTFDKRTGSYVPAQLGGAAAAAPAAPVQAPPGVYIDPSLPPEVQQQIAAAEASGQQVPAQMFFGGSGGGRPASPFVGMSPAEEAASKRAAEASVDLAVLPQRQAIETQGAVERSRAENAVQQQVEQQQKQRERDTVFAQYEAAIGGLRSGLANATTGPIAGRLPALTADAQIAEGAVAALAPVLKQLFRAAGEGTFTDRDQVLLLEMVPTRTDLPAAREAKLQNIDNIVRAKLGQGGIYGPAPSDGPPAGNRLQNTSRVVDGPAVAPVRRARNPQTGEVLVLRNGQWVPE